MKHHEDQESMALWQRAQLNPILRDNLIHIPNGGKRNQREAARMKRMGTRKGVSDYHLPVARGIHHSLWLELKPDVKGYSPQIKKEQLEWREKMRKQENAAYIVKGWQTAITIMLAYLEIETDEDIRDYALMFYSKGRFDCIDNA